MTKPVLITMIDPGFGATALGAEALKHFFTPMKGQ